MGSIIFVSGGARSGKSSYAEQFLSETFHSVAYIATAIAFDDEMKDRIAKHQAQRPSHWTTYEAYKDLSDLMTTIGHQHEACLLDCLTIMVTNLMMDACDQIDWNAPNPDAVNALQGHILSETQAFLDAAKKTPLCLVLVGNELGMGIVPENAMARAFRDIAGRVNQLVAKNADEAYLLMSGLPLCLKGPSVARPNIGGGV